MNDIGLFIFGSVIFVAFMVGLLGMVNEQHKIQSRRPSEGGKLPGERER